MKYKQLYDGVWTRPVMRGYMMCCCDCGLAHKIDFRIKHVGARHEISMRVRRMTRNSAAIRRRPHDYQRVITKSK